MNTRSFWNIVLKLIGIWLMLGLIYIIPTFFHSLITIALEEYSDTGLIIVISLFVVLFYIWLLRLLLFKTDVIIDKLKLEKGFTENKIDLKIDNSSLLSIGIIIIGALTVIESLPSLCRRLIIFFQQEQLIHEYSEISWVIFDFIKALLGYLLLTNYKVVSKYLDNKIKP